MKSVSVQGVSKVYALGKHNTNFKEFILETAGSVFSKKNGTENGQFYALKDVSFELDTGDVLGIIGDNGAGKSTLLKIISGVSQPSTGEIRLNGKISSILEIGTGFHMELTGKENIFLSGSILGMQREEIERQYDNILRFSGLNEFIDVPIKRYSSGMYLRLAFSVLAHLSAEIILLDEIIYVGDAEFKIKSYNKIKELAQSGKTILVVSHDLNSISDLCTKCLLLEEGQIRLFGETSDIVRRYMDKSLSKYMKFNREEHNHKMKEEIDDLKGKIDRLENDIRHKEDNLNHTARKEQALVTELDKLKESAEELHRIRNAMKAKSEAEIKDKDALATERSWEDEQIAPGNDKVKVKRIAIRTADNKPVIYQSDEVLIEIEYWKYVEEPFTIGLSCMYNFSQLAFGAASSYGTDHPVQNAGTGLFKHTCHIDRYLLNHGVFGFSIVFLDQSGGKVFGLQNIIFLKIDMMPELAEKHNYKVTLMGPFMPGFRWS